MVVFREKAVQEIMALAADRGVPMPSECKRALLQMWHMLDLPSNRERMGYAANQQVLQHRDIMMGICLMVKIDMLANDPVGTEKRDGFKRLAFSQRSFVPLLLALRGEIWNTKMDVVREWVKLRYEPKAMDWKECGDTGVWGVPVQVCGRLQYEGWGDPKITEEVKKNSKRGVHKLFRPDQIFLREGLKRGWRFEAMLLQCVLEGYVGGEELGDVDWDGEEKAEGLRRRGTVLEVEGEYHFNDVVGGARCVPGVAEGGDALLDVGSRKRKGRGKIKLKDKMSCQETQWRSGEREYKDETYRRWLSQYGVERNRWLVDAAGEWVDHDEIG
jgi:hypothetical protein